MTSLEKFEYDAWTHEEALQKFEQLILWQRRVVFLLWLQKRKGAA